MWQCATQPGTGPDGLRIVSVLGKQTYRFQPDGKIEIDEDEPIALAEERKIAGKEDLDLDPILVESDLVAWKPMADVVVHGEACAPRGKRARFFDVGLLVAGRTSMVRVFGDRKIDISSGGLRFTDPELFETMPLHWGLAYGGHDVLTDPSSRLVYPRNPVGKGFLIAPPYEKIHGFALPNLENPHQALTPDTILLKRFEQWKKAPVPMAFGWTSPHFHDRSVAGSETKKPPQAPLKTPPSPNAAPAFLRFPRLQGDEPVALGYMDPDFPRIEFSLPADVPRAYLDLGRGAITLPTILQTVEIYPATRQITLLWRGAAKLGAGLELETATMLEGWMESGPSKTVVKEERKPMKNRPPAQTTSDREGSQV
jgi:hypothetical protein